MSELPGDVSIDLAQVLRMAGKSAEAEQAAREALVLFERKGNRPSSSAARAFIEVVGTPRSRVET